MTKGNEGARTLKIIIRSELLLIISLVIILTIVITFSSLNILRIILGLSFVLFLPGYTLIAALFPRKEGIGGIERVALSLGLSLAVVPLIGLILNYIPWGIRLESILYSLASFIIITSAIAWFRRKRLPIDERFSVEFHLAFPGWRGGRLDGVLSIILVVAILGALGAMGYVIATPKIGEKFTELYILGIENKATDYPRELKLGEEARVIIGIVNNEYETISYRVVARINGVECNEVGPVVLEHDEKWEGKIIFIPEVAGPNQKVEFFLYKNGEAEPCLEPLRLWINVKQMPSQ